MGGAFDFLVWGVGSLSFWEGGSGFWGFGAWALEVRVGSVQGVLFVVAGTPRLVPGLGFQECGFEERRGVGLVEVFCVAG